MSDVEPAKNDPQPAAGEQDFARSAEQKSPGLLAEFLDFLVHNKSWWLTPIILVLLLIGVLAFLSSSSAVAPFIYTVF